MDRFIIRSPSSSAKRKKTFAHEQGTPEKIRRDSSGHEEPNCRKQLIPDHKTTDSSTDDQHDGSFVESDDDFENFMSTLSEDVMSGSQPLPDDSHGGKIDASMFPTHVLENIFSCLPVGDMVVTCSVVCSKWNEIISCEKFMLWKKLYHRVRNKDEEAIRHVECLLNLRQDDDPTKSASQDKSLLIINVIRLMGVWRPVPLSECESQQLQKVLKESEFYDLACDLIKKRILSPNDVTTQENVHFQPWMITAMIILLSHNISQLKIFHEHLLHAISLPIVMDFFYAVALSCWILYKKNLISQELHYRIYCAISSIENASTPLPIDVTTHSDDVLRLTHEQLKVVSHEFKTSDMVRVIAYAGAGKTRTLVECVKSKPHVKFLYTSFGKAVVDRGREVLRYCHNVECRTLHSLAYRGMDMYKYPHKLSDWTMRVGYIREKLSLADRSDIPPLILKTINNFLASSASGITLFHVPLRHKVKREGQYFFEDVAMRTRENVLELAKIFWRNMTDLTNRNWMMSSDCYLKQWHLTYPVISNYDVILLDEAQDCTDCMRDILVRQQNHAALVFVGDSHQQIYGFRKARDALVAIQPTHTYYLTQSFRFGNEIAQVADCILRAFKFGDSATRHGNGHRLSAISDKTLLGVGSPGSVFGEIVGKQSAVLCRTNLEVIKKTLDLLRENPDKKVAVVGGADKLGLHIIQDLYALSKPIEERMRLGLVVKCREYKYMDIHQIRDEAIKSDDNAMLAKLEIVNELGDRIPEVIKTLKGLPRCIESADYVVSTLHKAKGLEFDTVILCDDFAKSLVDLLRSGNTFSRYNTEEANLLYVAATRAKRSLVMSPTLCTLLDHLDVRFIEARPTSQFFDDVEESVSCARCRALLEQTSSLTFYQPKIEKMQDEGPMCRRCGALFAPGWGHLLGDPEQTGAKIQQEIQLMLQAHFISDDELYDDSDSTDE